MPEALAVLVVLALSVVIYVVAWFQSRDPANFNAAAELERLQLHEAWLRDRLQRATSEQWDHAMIAALTEELRATSQQLARVTVSSASR